MPREILVQVEAVTPERARRALLTGMQDTVRLSRVRPFVLAMQQGEWRPQGKRPIVIRDGVLINGFHRMLAVMLYGQPVEMEIRYEGQDVSRETPPPAPTGMVEAVLPPMLRGLEEVVP